MEQTKRKRGRPTGSKNKRRDVIRIEIPIFENGDDMTYSQATVDLLDKADRLYAQTNVAQLPRKRLDSRHAADMHELQGLIRDGLLAFGQLATTPAYEIAPDGYGDRLMLALATVAGNDGTANLTEDESAAIDVMRAGIGEFLRKYGCDQDLIDGAMNRFSNPATAACVKFIAGKFPDPDDLHTAISEFVFGSEFDVMGALGVTLDSTHKSKLRLDDGMRRWATTSIAGKPQASHTQRRSVNTMLARSKKHTKSAFKQHVRSVLDSARS